MNAAKGTIMDEVVSALYESAIEPKVSALGCGGAGTNIVSSISEKDIHGIETIAINTDAKSLERARTDVKILIGKEVTNGRGTGGRPEIGEFAAEAARHVIRESITSDIVFLIAGLGGGTGTGVAPIVADIARELGSVTVSIALMPFDVEGRRHTAEEGLQKLRKASEATIVLENQALLSFAKDMKVDAALSVIDMMVVKIIENVMDHISRSFLTTILEEVESVAREMEGSIPEKTIPVEVVPPQVVEASTEVGPISLDSNGFINLG